MDIYVTLMPLVFMYDNALLDILLPLYYLFCVYICYDYVSIAFCIFKAAKSVTFDLLILKIMFLFFKNTLKILKFR